MKCKRCGNLISSGDQYCEYCGISTVDEAEPIPEEKTNKSSFLGDLFWWKVNEDNIKYQANNYYNLKWSSYRAISALCLVFSSLLTFVFIVLKSYPSSSYVDISVFLFLAFFMYFGHRWALITSMFLWTLEKGYSIYDVMRASKGAYQIYMAIFFWALFMNYFYKAYRVERLRKQIFAKINRTEEIEN